jgi:hypothetical protein
MFKESLINFEIQVGEKTEKLSIARHWIHGFVEKEEHGLCIFTGYGVYKLLTSKDEVIKQIDACDAILNKIDQDRSAHNAKTTVEEMKKMMNESERDRLFGDNQ